MAKAKILLIEDEAVVALEVQTRLLQMGYDVAGICNTGEDAIARAVEIKPDILVTDIMLAGKINGIEAARQIRAKYGTAVIYITAYSDDATLRQAASTEPCGYIVKPYDPRTLRATIELAIRKRQLEQKPLVTAKPGQSKNGA
jgi:DNA-binding NarL/FixJ family response regulator